MGKLSSLSFSTLAAGSAPEERVGENGQTEFTIRQMAQHFGVSLRTLRFYESRGLLTPRRESNLRFYGAADRTRMEMIQQGKKLGFTLTEISDLMGGAGANDNIDLEERLGPQQIVNQIGYLERQRDQIDTALQRLRVTQGHLSQGAA
jgi:DNA-binding transcriptional MerR regulator